MNAARRQAGWFWKILSIPIYFKILGIGFAVAMVFGSITLLYTHKTISTVLYDNLRQTTLSNANLIRTRIERPLITGDMFAIRSHLDNIRNMLTDIRYIIIRDADGEIVSHTFQHTVPSDIRRVFPDPPLRKSRFQVLGSEEGRIFDICMPIMDGKVGSLQIGSSDQNISQKLSALSQSMLVNLALCAAIGAILALLLTHILTYPIHHLVQTTNRIRGGDFECRAELYSEDEIGRLAIAFNQMARGLQIYKQEVQDKETTRLKLLDKLVQAQEHERKHIARELHDELGQSLHALLLASLHGKDPKDSSMAEKIRSLIDKVRRLAWGMRPSILDDYGLDSALERYTQEIAKQSGLTVDYQYTSFEGAPRLPNRIETTLYRIAQESMTNILRHSQAKRASVILLQRPNEVMLLIDDDGCGFDPDAIDHSLSLGLAGMKERAGLMGGDFAIESEPSKGTTIRVQIPLRGSA